MLPDPLLLDTHQSLIIQENSHNIQDSATWKRRGLSLREALLRFAEHQVQRIDQLLPTVQDVEFALKDKISSLDARSLIYALKVLQDALKDSAHFVDNISKNLKWDEIEELILTSKQPQSEHPMQDIIHMFPQDVVLHLLTELQKRS